MLRTELITPRFALTDAALALHLSLKLIRYLQRTEGTASQCKYYQLNMMEYSNTNRVLPKQEISVIQIYYVKVQ